MFIFIAFCQIVPQTGTKIACSNSVKINQARNYQFFFNKKLAVNAQ